VFVALVQFLVTLAVANNAGKPSIFIFVVATLPLASTTSIV